MANKRHSAETYVAALESAFPAWTASCISKAGRTSATLESKSVQESGRPRRALAVEFPDENAPDPAALVICFKGWVREKEEAARCMN